MFTWLASKAELLEARPEGCQVFLASHFAAKLDQMAATQYHCSRQGVGFR